MDGEIVHAIERGLARPAPGDATGHALGKLWLALQVGPVCVFVCVHVTRTCTLQRVYTRPR